MEGFDVCKVVSFTLLLIVVTLPLIAAASLCPDKQFLHSRLQTCLNCSECGPGLVALRPCELHRDTHCGPISELIKTLQASQGSGLHHRHRHQGRRKEHEGPQVTSGQNGEDIVWRYGDDIQKKTDQPPSVSPDGHPQEASPLAMEVSSSEVPFSGAETLVWDWQAVALTTAVFACILFFLAVTLYSLHQARQWRRLKENFEADVEELSARLSLMAAASACSSELKGDKCELLIADKEAIEDSDYFARCRYLQKLLSDSHLSIRARKRNGWISTAPVNAIAICKICDVTLADRNK